MNPAPPNTVTSSSKRSIIAPPLPRRRAVDKARSRPLSAPPTSYILIPCPGGGIGRRTSFRCWRSQGRGGSSPLLGTIPFYALLRRINRSHLCTECCYFTYVG